MKFVHNMYLEFKVAMHLTQQEQKESETAAKTLKKATVFIFGIVSTCKQREENNKL